MLVLLCSEAGCKYFMYYHGIITHLNASVAVIYRVSVSCKRSVQLSNQRVWVDCIMTTSVAILHPNYTSNRPAAGSNDGPCGSRAGLDYTSLTTVTQAKIGHMLGVFIRQLTSPYYADVQAGIRFISAR